MSQTYKRSDNLVERTIRNQAILVPIMNRMEALDSLFNLNETAAFIWQNACEGLSEDQIAEKLTENYRVDLQTAQKDVQNVLSELVAIGALVPNRTELP